MKIFVKLSSLIIGFSAIVMPTLLSSCDGGSSEAKGNIALRLAEIAESLDAVVAGDEITLTTTSGSEILTGPITATEPLKFSGGSNISFTYAKTGINDFSLSGSVEAVTNFNTALSNSIGDPAPLNAELRSILLNKVYGRPELQRIIDILGPAGPVDLVLHPTKDVILAVVEMTYLFWIESTNSELLDGEISVIFNSRILYYPVKFRPPTTSQLASIRLITPSHDIPFLDIWDSTLLEDTQGGLFNMSLVNVPATIVP